MSPPLERWEIGAQVSCRCGFVWERTALANVESICSKCNDNLGDGIFCLRDPATATSPR